MIEAVQIMKHSVECNDVSSFLSSAKDIQKFAEKSPIDLVQSGVLKVLVIAGSKYKCSLNDATQEPFTAVVLCIHELAKFKEFRELLFCTSGLINILTLFERCLDKSLQSFMVDSIFFLTEVPSLRIRLYNTLGVVNSFLRTPRNESASIRLKAASCIKTLLKSVEIHADFAVHPLLSEFCYDSWRFLSKEVEESLQRMMEEFEVEVEKLQYAHLQNEERRLFSIRIEELRLEKSSVHEELASEVRRRTILAHSTFTGYFICLLLCNLYTRSFAS